MERGLWCTKVIFLKWRCYSLVECEALHVSKKKCHFMMLIGLLQKSTVITRNVYFGNNSYAILLMRIFAEAHQVYISFEGTLQVSLLRVGNDRSSKSRGGWFESWKAH